MPEQREESVILTELHELLNELSIIREVGDEGDSFNDWVFIGHVSNLDDSEKDGYITMTQRGLTPSHIVYGLLREATLRFEAARL